MSLSILISDPNKESAKETLDFLEEKAYVCDKVNDGKECQLKIYQKKYFAVVLDFETAEHTALEVLQYIQLTSPSLKVIITVKDEAELKELELDRDTFLRLGASDALIQPFTHEDLLASIEGASQYASWKDISSSGEQRGEEEIDESDDEFAAIKIEEFFSGKTMIFDCYIKLTSSKYIKILHKGDSFEKGRIQKYIDEKNMTHLFFKKSERSIYINYINDVLDRMTRSKKVPTKKKMDTAKGLTEKYVEEIYMEGLKPQLIEEGKKICESIYTLVQSDKKLSSLMARYEEYDESAYAHLFLVSLISAITCQNLAWSSQKTVELIAFGALLHDIGKLKLPSEIAETPVDKLTEEQFEQYKEHPKLGAEMLQDYPLVSEPVRQIVYQHHEQVTGEGFPNSLTGIKIYPLAKVVSFADEFSSFITRNKVSPLVGIKLMLPNKNLMAKFDPEIVKALVKGLAKDKKKPTS